MKKHQASRVKAGVTKTVNAIGAEVTALKASAGAALTRSAAHAKPLRMSAKEQVDAASTKVTDATDKARSGIMRLKQDVQETTAKAKARATATAKAATRQR